MPNRSFWQDKKVFLTGHSGFKGVNLSVYLQELGARVSGFSQPPNTTPSMFDICRMADRMNSTFGDVRDLDALARTLTSQQPEIVFHLAAQPLVLRAYSEPVSTMATNIMGTVHLLEAARHIPSVRAVIVITSDKCYQNREWVWGYREDEAMGGRDPYSASKGCAELVVAAYQHSFYESGHSTVATTRAGNVIGGGDWSDYRIVPDAVRTLAAGDSLAVRNPGAIRPWQHVFEPLCGYLMLAERVFSEQKKWAGGWNFGPYDTDAVPVSTLADMVVQSWGDNASWHAAGQANSPHEDTYLKLDSSKARQLLGWRPRLTVCEAVQWSVDWYQRVLRTAPSENMYEYTREQIRAYEARGDLNRA